MFEASGATRVPSGEGMLVVDDGRPGEVLWMRLGARGIETVTPVSMGGTIADPEGITNDGTWIYVVGSQSCGAKDAADLVRFKFDGATGRASGFEAFTGLPELLASAMPGGDTGDKGKKKDKRLNIEGLAWDAARKRLMIGVRSPLSGGDALVIPVAVGAGPLGASSLAVQPVLRVALGGAGIRSIEQVDGGFLIVAGGVTDASSFRLLSWSGSGTPTAVTDLPTTLKPEGVARVRVEGRMITVILGDSGRYATVD